MNVEKKFESNQPKTTTEKLANGELTSFERNVVTSIYKQSARYGVSPEFNNFSGETGVPMGVVDGAWVIQTEVSDLKADLVSIHRDKQFHNLSPDDRKIASKLMFDKPEELKDENLSWRSIDEFIENPDIDKLDEAELEELMRKRDEKMAEHSVSGDFDSVFGEKNPHKHEDKVGYLEKVLRLVGYFADSRHGFQEAAKLQLEKGKIVPCHLTDGKEYLDKVVKSFES